MQVTESDIINGYRYHFDKEGKPYFNNLHQWKLDAEKGTQEVGEGSNYISNPEFEADRKITATPTGWKVRDNVGNYSVSMHAERLTSVIFVIQETAPEDYISDLYQEITGLPNGTYTMTAWVKAVADKMYVMYTHKAVTKRKHIPLKQILMIGKKLLLQQI